MMIYTVLVPDWDATADLVNLARIRDENKGHDFNLFGYDVVFEPLLGCYRILVQGRLLTIPEVLRVLPFKKYILMKHNHPYDENLNPGRYEDFAGAITARVENFVVDRVVQLSVQVTGDPTKVTLRGLNQWFDELLRGWRHAALA